MTKAEAIAVVTRMGELEAMGSKRVIFDPFPYEQEAVCLLTPQEGTDALRAGMARITGNRISSF